MELVHNLFSNVGRRIHGFRVADRLNSEDDGTTVLAASNAAAQRVVGIVKVVQAFADGDGGQPTLKIGDTSDDDRLVATALLADAAKGDIFTFAGIITAAEPLNIIWAAATGTGTGAVEIEAVVLPATF